MVVVSGVGICVSVCTCCVRARRPVPHLLLDILDGVARLDIKSDGLAGQCLDEDLHAATKAQHEMQGGLLLDVVVRERAAILELFARKDQALLVRRDALLVLDLAEGKGRL